VICESATRTLMVLDTRRPVRAARIDKDELFLLRPKGLLETYRIHSGMRTASQHLGRRNQQDAASRRNRVGWPRLLVQRRGHRRRGARRIRSAVYSFPQVCVTGDALTRAIGRAGPPLRALSRASPPSAPAPATTASTRTTLRTRPVGRGVNPGAARKEGLCGSKQQSLRHAD
jgi:hypothetical protein